MSPRSRLVAGVLLTLMPTIVYGGASILSLPVGEPGYDENELRQPSVEGWPRGVLLVLALITSRYVDAAALLDDLETLVRHSIPAAAVLSPVAFFPSSTLPTPAPSRWPRDSLPSESGSSEAQEQPGDPGPTCPPLAD